MSCPSSLPTATACTSSLELEQAVRVVQPSPNVATYELLTTGGRHDEVYGSGNGNGKGSGFGANRKATHRRVISASDVSLKRMRDGQRQLLESQAQYYSQDEPIPELFLGEPLEAIDESERRTLQTQWADALKRVRSLRGSSADYVSQSERWSGVSTDIHMVGFRTGRIDQSRHAYSGAANATRGSVPTAVETSLDHWNYYPGPSVTRDTATTLQLSTQALVDHHYNSITSGTGETWPSHYVQSSLIGGAALIPSRVDSLGRAGGHHKELTTTGRRGARSVTTFDTPQQSQLEINTSDPLRLAQPASSQKCNVIGENAVLAATDHQAKANCTTSTAQIVDEHTCEASYSEYCNSVTVSRSAPVTSSASRRTEVVPPPRSASYSALVSGVQRTQSQRYYGGPRSSRWPGDQAGLVRSAPPPPGRRQDAGDDTAGSLLPPAISTLKKAVSMREGGQHADAVTQMGACASGSDSFGSDISRSAGGKAKKTVLDCASCGRGLGVVVQTRNPGVDTAFCVACRPSQVSWKSTTRSLKVPDHDCHHVSAAASAKEKQKNGMVMRFCRKILRLNKKLS